jgi:DNA-binding GntR family transcriptional regulator
MPSSKTAVKTAASRRFKASKNAGAHSLDKIASKYHSRMRTVHASSDSLSEGVVVPALREAIVEGVLAPGSRLSEVQVAKQLNVSRTPMREAFAQLEREGLVTVLPRVGAYVRAVTLRDVEEIYTVRAALECLAVQLASERITALGSAQLDDVIEAMRSERRCRRSGRVTSMRWIASTRLS